MNVEMTPERWVDEHGMLEPEPAAKVDSMVHPWATSNATNLSTCAGRTSTSASPYVRPGTTRESSIAAPLMWSTSDPLMTAINSPPAWPGEPLAQTAERRVCRSHCMARVVPGRLDGEHGARCVEVGQVVLEPARSASSENPCCDEGVDRLFHQGEGVRVLAVRRGHHCDEFVDGQGPFGSLPIVMPMPARCTGFWL